MVSKKLLQLPDDILFILFRTFIPLKDKLRLLRTMDEFFDILTQRETYLSSPVPFSSAYLQRLSQIRPGWYYATRNWTQRFCLRIDPETLNFAIYHFFLEGFEGHYKPAVLHQHFFRASIDRVFGNIENFLTQYQYLEEEEKKEDEGGVGGFKPPPPPPPKMYMYRLQGYGLILIDSAASENGCHHFRFYDWSEVKIRPGRWQNIYCRWRLDTHFKVKWKLNKTLYVKCMTPAPYYCHCETRFQRLSPITYRVSPNLSCLKWNEQESVPLVGVQEFRLEEDEEHMESKMTYHVNYKFYNSLEVEVIARRNERLRSQLE